MAAGVAGARVAGAWLACLGLLLLPQGARGQIFYPSPGLLAEYFSPLPIINGQQGCDAGGNGSIGVLDTLMPNITRRDPAIDFKDESDTGFSLRRCTWEIGPDGYPAYQCRANQLLGQSFGARWQGYLDIGEAGDYTFQLEADDGARLVLGHMFQCDKRFYNGVLCGDRDEVGNFMTMHSQFPPTKSQERKNDGDGVYGKQCDQCAQGSYTTCFNTGEGCEPFALWRLEGDGGAGGGCRSSGGVRTVSGRRWLGAGQHPIMVEYFQRGGTGSCKLKYSGPSTGDRLVPIPTKRFIFPKGVGLRAEWFSLPEPLERLPDYGARGTLPPGTTFLKREDNNFQLTGAGEGEFASYLFERNLPTMVRFHGFILIRRAGNYEFKLTSDDGARLIFGGRGPRPPRIVVDNDGIHPMMYTSVGFEDMLPGNTPIILELLYSPGALGDRGLPRPPGIKVTLKGPDTVGPNGDQEEWDLGRANGGLFLRKSDNECQMAQMTWGTGLTMARDCTGRCFDTSEIRIGDRLCDDGSTFGRLVFTCKEFFYDNGDCEAPPAFVPATPAPDLRCLVSCPQGQWNRRNCSACAETDSSGRYCVESADPQCTPSPRDPNTCKYTSCCNAKFESLVYWDEDCEAFGAVKGKNCTEATADRLAEINAVEPSLDRLAAIADGAPEVGKAVGRSLNACTEPDCNVITTEKKRDLFTGEAMERAECLIDEAETEGKLCWVGPWEVEPRVTNPLFECQAGEFKWNFCRDRNTFDGKPFTRCCTMTYMDRYGTPTCRFFGLAQGTCESYVPILAAKLGENDFSRISNPILLKECEGDLCNDPSDEEFGCPGSVIEFPEQTKYIRPREMTLAQILAQGAPEKTDPPLDLSVVIVLLCFVLVLACGCLVLYVASQETESSAWHSAKANVISADTFVEPQQDGGRNSVKALEGIEYGVVQNRPFALQRIVDSQKVPIRALRMDPGIAAPEAQEAAQDAALIVEAAVRGVDVDSLRRKASKSLAPPPDMRDQGEIDEEARLRYEARRVLETGGMYMIANEVLRHTGLQKDIDEQLKELQLPGVPDQELPSETLALCDPSAPADRAAARSLPVAQAPAPLALEDGAQEQQLALADLGSTEEAARAAVAGLNEQLSLQVMARDMEGARSTMDRLGQLGWDGGPGSSANQPATTWRPPAPWRARSSSKEKAEKLALSDSLPTLDQLAIAVSSGTVQAPALPTLAERAVARKVVPGSLEEARGATSPHSPKAARPAAVARLMRKGLPGGPRVAT